MWKYSVPSNDYTGIHGKSHRENANSLPILTWPPARPPIVNPHQCFPDDFWFICPETHFRSPLKWSCSAEPLRLGSWSTRYEQEQPRPPQAKGHSIKANVPVSIIKWTVHWGGSWLRIMLKTFLLSSFLHHSFHSQMGNPHVETRSLTGLEISFKAS